VRGESESTGVSRQCCQEPSQEFCVVATGIRKLDHNPQDRGTPDKMNPEEITLVMPSILQSEIVPNDIEGAPAALLPESDLVQSSPRRAKINNNEMPATKVTKHELKTRETRELLLRAAETIFVRDGYKGAELGEIASLAGRTKGAIYAQFKSKEDIFLALIEDHILRNRAEMAILLGRSDSVEGNLAVMRKFYLRLAEDDSFGLLMLEFKLFCVRNPKSQKRLQKLFSGVISSDQEKRYSQFLGSAGTGKNDISRVTAVQVLQPMLSALILETKLESGIFGERDLKKVAGRMFDALFDPK